MPTTLMANPAGTGGRSHASAASATPTAARTATTSGGASTTPASDAPTAAAATMPTSPTSRSITDPAPSAPGQDRSWDWPPGSGTAALGTMVTPATRTAATTARVTADPSSVPIASCASHAVAIGTAPSPAIITTRRCHVASPAGTTPPPSTTATTAGTTAASQTATSGRPACQAVGPPTTTSASTPPATASPGTRRMAHATTITTTTATNRPPTDAATGLYGSTVLAHGDAIRSACAAMPSPVATIHSMAAHPVAGHDPSNAATTTPRPGSVDRTDAVPGSVSDATSVPVDVEVPATHHLGGPPR
jgi:hypothetical protein